MSGAKKKIVFITPGVETGGAEKQLALLAKVVAEWFAPLIIALSLSERRQRLSILMVFRLLKSTAEIISARVCDVENSSHGQRSQTRCYSGVDVCWQYNGIDYRR